MGNVILLFGQKMSNKEKKTYTMALNGHRPNNFHTTPNQKYVSATVGSMEGWWDRQEVRGNCDTIIWGIELSNQK